MGYKREQFQERVDENLICPICREVLQDPLQCRDGHIFCRDCITKWLNTNQKCPMDNKPLQASNLVHILVVKNMIDSLNVYCHVSEDDEETDNDSEGCRSQKARVLNLTAREEKQIDYYQYPRTLRCEWTGKLESLEKHRETCPFQQVQCTNENCNTKIQRRELQDHDKICEHKKVDCEKCGLYLIRHELVNHKMKDCPEVLVPCPNKCTSPQGQNTQIKRMDLNHHLSNVCAKTIVDCPYKDQGCSVQVERQDVEKHVQENMAAHNKLLVEHCSSLTKVNQLLKDELNELKAGLSSANTRQYTWIIYDFPALCDKHPNGSRFTSPTFWLCGYKLRLEIYPNGRTKDASEFISLFLHLCKKYSGSSDKDTNASNSETTLKYRLSMISQKPFTKDVSFEATDVFKEQKGRGWSKFIKRTDALSADYWNSTSGSIIVSCTILQDKP